MAPIYLNAAGTGPFPPGTVDSLAAFNAKRAAPWTITLDEQFGTLATARAHCARLIGAASDEIALVPNTSTGLHVASLALPVAPGRAILSHAAEFPANVTPWTLRARHDGRPYETIPLGDDGLPDQAALIARIGSGDVGLVAISWVSYLSGDRADLAAVGAACRAAGAWFVVDAIQGVGATPLDVSRLSIDVLACGAQKWLRAPWGSGFAYVRRELVSRLEPGTGGWLSTQHSHDLSRIARVDLDYLDDARRFEVATLAYQDFVGLNASLDSLFQATPAVVYSQIAALASRLADGLAAIPGLTMLTARDPARRAGIVSCLSTDPGVRERLAAAGVICSIRDIALGPLHGMLIRLSPHVYNTPDEIDAVLCTLDTR
jgi:selenocysteine lyase/cysteine desulfurase